jgi:cellulose biosynthesis protein BcsQ
MAIISFWSDTRKETAQTLSMIALASYLAVENNSKILIIDTNVNDKTITDAFWPQQESSTRKLVNQLSAGKIDLGSGIEGLAKLITSGKTDPEVIPDYARVVFKGRLEAVLSFITDHPEEASRIDSTYVELIKIANQKYDYVFVDVRKGMSDPLTNQILEISNVIVYNFTQRLVDLDRYNETKKNNPYFQKNRVLPLIGRYDRFSKYNKKNIARYIGEKKDIPAVSYNTLFFESANEGGLGDYFLKFRKSLISSSDRNANFVEEVANAADRLVLKVQEVQMMR